MERERERERSRKRQSEKKREKERDRQMLERSSREATGKRQVARFEGNLRWDEVWLG